MGPHAAGILRLQAHECALCQGAGHQVRKIKNIQLRRGHILLGYCDSKLMNALFVKELAIR